MLVYINIQAIVLRLPNLEKVFDDVKTNFAELTTYNRNLKNELSKLLTEKESLQNSL